MSLAPYHHLLRSLLPPQLVCLLLFPLAFYLTRGVRVWNPDNFLEYKRVSTQALDADYENREHRLEFVCYLVCGLTLDAQQYRMVQCIATACLEAIRIG